MFVPDVLEESCATRQALERLASKWRVLLIYALLDGPQRPARLRRRVAGITQKVLTATLREMQADGMVDRIVLKETHPQHVEYALTPLGQTLRAPLAAICDWAVGAGPAELVHLVDGPAETGLQQRRQGPFHEPVHQPGEQHDGADHGGQQHQRRQVR